MMLLFEVLKRTFPVSWREAHSVTLYSGVDLVFFLEAKPPRKKKTSLSSPYSPSLLDIAGSRNWSAARRFSRSDGILLGNAQLCRHR